MGNKPLLLLAMVAPLLAQDGIRPRSSASEYAAHRAANGVTIAATILSPEQARKLFAADLTKLGYTVVEVAVYPDKETEVATRDFLLRTTSGGSTVRPAAPSTIAGRMKNKDGPPKIPERVQVYTAETVGYSTGGPYNRGGVYTGTSVGVGIGDPPAQRRPQTSGKDSDSLSVQVDLENQALPEGRFSKPVAGYLYFPADLKKSRADLTWYGADGQILLPLPSKK
jgi:hypothetical protein